MGNINAFPGCSDCMRNALPLGYVAAIASFAIMLESRQVCHVPDCLHANTHIQELLYVLHVHSISHYATLDRIAGCQSKTYSAGHSIALHTAFILLLL